MIYSQNDPSWKNLLLGFNTSSAYTIGTAGCYVTAIANVCVWAGNDLNPTQINDTCKQNSWFVDGGLISRNDVPALLCSNLAFAGRTNWSGPTPMDFFADASDPNVAYIICLDASPAAGIQTHFVMVWAYLNDHDLEIDDSWDGVRKPLSHYGNPSAIIQSATKFIKAPPAPISPYTIEAITPKQVKLNKDTHLWGLNYDNFTAINSNPQATALAGTILTARAVLHHNIGYDYYLSDPNVASGYNVLDADNYTPPAPPAPEPHQLPEGPMVIPNSETYELVKDVEGFLTSNQAVNHVNGQVTIPAGGYFVFNKRFNAADANQLIAVNLTKTPGKPGAWINTLDNVETPPEPELPAEQLIIPTPVPPDFTTTYKPLPQPLVYVAMSDVPVTDFVSQKKVTMPKYSVTYISGTFTVDGVDYGRPKSAVDKNMWWGVELIDSATKLPNIELESEVFNAKTTLPEREATKTLQPLDRLALGVAHARNIYLTIAGFFSKIKLARKNKN